VVQGEKRERVKKKKNSLPSAPHCRLQEVEGQKISLKWRKVLKRRKRKKKKKANKKKKETSNLGLKKKGRLVDKKPGAIGGSRKAHQAHRGGKKMVQGKKRKSERRESECKKDHEELGTQRKFKVKMKDVPFYTAAKTQKRNAGKSGRFK